MREYRVEYKSLFGKWVLLCTAQSMQRAVCFYYRLKASNPYREVRVLYSERGERYSLIESEGGDLSTVA